MYNANDALGNAITIPPEGGILIGECIAQIAAILMQHDPNFLQGNPAAFQVPTDIKDVDIRFVISLSGKSIAPRIARVR